jgi:dipeptidyl aminopeptidase/acylaminoacyl peptidase
VRAVTGGDFEVFDIAFGTDPEVAWALSNRAHPTEYDLYRIDLRRGDLTRLSTLKGVESYVPDPAVEQVLIRYSDPYMPAQAAVLPINGGELRAATDTRTEAYKAIDWQPVEFVGIPSSHVDEPIWTKFYPARGGLEGPRPIVVFVHGAGYTQNTHHRFPYYFREQMFHNLLSERGYHVIDMDYRASRGYGRDWRTAIYRQMGTPELEDLIDGVNWVVENHNGDPDRVGVYGGSYGGFMTFMAMFNAPEVFAAGASLRPVTDWAHYNHFYTSNILNTPEVDPEAYRRSSPIEFVDGLEGDLLISHGMLDDNVFWKDSIRLVQRLIELEKEDWELASYPLEPHGYVHPESWLDQYRRILKLFEESIGDAVPIPAMTETEP